MEPYLGLVKFRSIQFDRVGEDVFIAHLLDEHGNVVVTFDTQILDVDEAYIINFSNDNVCSQLKIM
jgi:hypothetical protein